MKQSLSLCMISYQKDASDLHRCLTSITQIPGLLDEIIIVDTSQTESEEIKKICSQFNARYYHRAFNQDFSEVRNYSFSLSSCQKIMWLDSDDEISLENLKKLIRLKESLDQYDIWLMDYNYGFDQDNKPALVLPRERIVSNKPEIRWMEPVHECLSIQNHSMMKADIAIDHRRCSPGSSERNLAILKSHQEKGTLSVRGTFYLGKEIFDSGSMKEAEDILKNYIETAQGLDFVDNLSQACLKLGQYYGSIDDVKRAKLIALKSLQFSTAYSEIFCLLGDVYQLEGNVRAAIHYYYQALSCRLGSSGMSQLAIFYHFIPHRALALLYNKIGDTYNTRRHASIALSYQRDEDLKKLLGDADVNPRVAWLFPGPANPVNGSQRIRRINVHKALPDSRIIENYLSLPFHELMERLRDRNVVVFQNFCYPDLMLMKLLKAANKRVVFDDCEAISGFPYQDECMKAADAITCCSETLAEIRSSQGYQRVAIIPDAWEPVENAIPDYTRTRLKAGFFGMGGNSFLVTSWLRATIEAAGYELVVCTEWDDATVKWDLNTWAEEMLKCDVILCPQRVDVQPAKSNVKVSQALSMGLPVIASPLPAYCKIIKNGVNGYIASTLEEWGVALEALKDPQTRQRMGEQGRMSVGHYSIDAIKTYYTRLLGDILIMGDTTIEPKIEEPKQQPQTNIIDIIIPVYDGWDYLRLCLDSILLNTTADTPYRIIISDAGSSEQTWQRLRALKGIEVLGSPMTRLNFSEACNAGISHSNSKYFVIMNSDVIVSKGWLTNLVKKMDSVNRLSSCGPLSNCNSGWTINAPGRPSIDLKVNNQLILRPGMKIGEITPHLDDLNAYMIKSNEQHKGEFMKQEWLASFCTIYARSAIDEVGLYDPMYQNGCEDLDLGKRLRAQGYIAGEAYDCFVYHFGGISRYTLQEQNREQYDKDDRYNHEKYARKWSRKRVAIYTGPAWEPWNKFTVDQGMAGSETWAAYMAEAFSKHGYDVTIYGHLDHPKAELAINGVRYADHRNMIEDLQYVYVDLFISSRTVDPVSLKIHALKAYVMIHDIWLHPDKNHDMHTDLVNRYYYLSQWHKDFVKSHHTSIPEEKLYKTANGIAPYYDDAGIYVKQNKTVYSSSPDRGLLQLLELMPEIRKAVPDFELIICYGFHNWESAAKLRNDHVSLRMIERIKELMDQPGVIYKGRVNKAELAKYQKESKIWLYPTWFTETFCISAVENRASQNAIVTTGLGGLLDTVGDTGVLLPPQGLSREGSLPDAYKEKFLEEAIRMLTDETYRLSWVTKTSKEDLNKYSWSEIVKGFLA